MGETLSLLLFGEIRQTHPDLQDSVVQRRLQELGSQSLRSEWDLIHAYAGRGRMMMNLIWLLAIVDFQRLENSTLDKSNLHTALADLF